MQKTRLMGILNTTPDSFFDGGSYLKLEDGIRRGIQAWREGADILDIGGESTRPGAASVDEAEEIRRTLPLVRALKKELPIPISIDTMKPAVAEAALDAGADFINDVTGFAHPEMRKLAAQSQAEICVMHMQGTPKTMQADPSYPEGIIAHLKLFFQKQISLLLEAGVKKEKIIIDPGIGFGKSVANNIEIIHNVPVIRSWGYPVLLGISRKSFMSKILNKPAADLLAATLAMATTAILSKTDILRVHDVAAHRDVINLINFYQSC
jgi:dihydropteroate synthase